MSDEKSLTTTSSVNLPVKRCQVDQRRPPEVAAGMQAVTKSARYMLKHMGVMRGTKTLLRLNQTHGFDCPSCAWPDPKHRSPFEFCENGAKAVLDEATERRVAPEFFKGAPISWLRTRSDHWLNARGRLVHPMIKRPDQDHYEPIRWEGAFELIAKALKGLDSPDEAIFYTSGRTSNEAAFLYQLFVRALGTNNMPDCSNMCHESSGTGLGETIGIGKGTVTLEDFDEAEVILVLGQNPGTNHPRMLTALERASRAGCKIVSVNPLKEPALIRFKHPQDPADMLGKGTPISSHYLQVRLNGDVALLRGLQLGLFELDAANPGRGVIDRDFIAQYTSGYEAFEAHVKQSDWDEVEQGCGIKRDEIMEIARLLATRERIIACWAMGLTQHKNGVANIQEVVNLLLMRGALGKPGAGVCPVRGHSNVQGDRTMGIWERPNPEFLERLKARFDFEPPRHHGHDVVSAIEAMRDGQAKVFFAMGGNFLSATPDTPVVAQALERCALTVHVSTKLNRAHLHPGQTSLILPCLGRTETDLQRSGPQFVSVENSMGIVHSSKGRLRPASPWLLSEPMIVARLAHAYFGPEHPVDWLNLAGDYDRIRDHIAFVVPGCEHYNQRVRQEHGFALPNPVRDSRTFKTHNGKANFTVHALPVHELGADQYMMMTIRSHDQYNTTIYALDDRYRGIHNERMIVMMAEQDMVAAGLVQGQLVRLTSHFQGKQRSLDGFIVVPYEMPSRCVATYFPEANPLIPLESYADKSRTPTSKSVVVSIDPM